MLIGSSVLMFARLGRYSLWTDEAVTAITAAGVWRTGDTSAWLDDHNLLAYRDGLLLKDQKDRYTSPLQFYVAAPFIGLLGHDAFAARLPFVLCGMGTILLIVRWLHRSNPPNFVWVAATIILLSSAEFFLFQRQCRYFALTTFLSTWIAYLYCHWNGTRRHLLGLGVAMSLLLASQYLDYAALVGCLLVDYGIWGRRRRVIRGMNWLLLTVPQLITAAVVSPIWNPIARAERVVQAVHPGVSHAVIHAASHAWLHEYLTLLWWNIRDMVACEFMVLPLLLVCPLLYLKQGNPWLLRLPLALLVFVAGIAFFTTHPLPPVGNAEVRYLAPVLPLCIAISIVAVAGMQTLRGWIRGALLTLAVLSIVQSSAFAFYHELYSPQTEPYTPVAQWINQNVSSDATIYVCPYWCVPSMMWDASKATYVWQLSDPPAADYRALPATFFKGRISPDYLIAFGPDLSEIKDWQSQFAALGIQYCEVATIAVYFKETIRPELIWREFRSITPKEDEKVYIFKRQR